MKKLLDVTPALVVLVSLDSLSDISSFTVKSEKPKGARKVDNSRVVLIDNQLIIARDTPDGVKVVFHEQVENYTRDGDNYRILTSTKKVVAIAKDKNCACGTRLKSWNPYKELD